MKQNLILTHILTLCCLLNIGPLQGQSSSANNTWLSTKYIGYNSGIPTGDLFFKTNGVTRATITTGLGYVGIGVAVPKFKLHVNGDLFVTGSGINNVPGTASLLFGDDNLQPQFGIEYNDGGLNFWKAFGSTNGSGGNGFGNHFLFIKDNGKVGIHTNNPTADFTVNGNMLVGNQTTQLPAGYNLYVETGILTEKLMIAVVNSSWWADYVFDENYPLLKVSELENYIKMHGHLPNVPSATEVKNDGIDVARMNAILLEKIEELSLYIIEQNKRIAALENKVNR